MSSPFRSLGLFNYRLWFLGATASNIGTWMQRTAQDWVVLTDLTDNDAAAVGITMALQFGPALVLTPLTGLVADTFDRRKVMLVTQAIMGALGVGLGVLSLTGVAQLWMVYVFALLLGVASAFDAPVRQTMVSELVPPANLSNAVGLNATSFNVARLIGPAAAGLLTAAVGAGWVFVINAGTFAAMIAAIVLLRATEMTPSPRAARTPGQMRAGVRYVSSRGDLLLVFVMIALMGTFGMNFPIYISTMASVVFGNGAGEFGVLSSTLAIGSLAGALLAAQRDRPRLRSVGFASAGFGLSLGAAAFAPNPIVFGAILAVVGLCSVTMLNNANAYVQTTTPPSLRGRVMALYVAIVMGGTLIGAPVVGWVANVAGPRWGLAVGAAAAIVAAGIAAGWWVRTRNAHLSWDAERRWPLVLAYDEPTRRELATTEIAVIETSAAKS